MLLLIIGFILNFDEISKFRYPIARTHVFYIQLLFEHWQSYEQFIHILRLYILQVYMLQFNLLL